MEYQNVVKDFAMRTRENLEIIRRLQRENPDYEVYEVTQLINSMLGLLIFPQQRYVNGIPQTPLAELAEQGWPAPKTRGKFQQVQDLRQLIRYLRNAIAHFNIEFLSDKNQQINGLRVWNTFTPRNEPAVKTWEAELSLADIENITDKFIELILQ